MLLVSDFQTLVSFLKSSCLKYLNKLLGYFYFLKKILVIPKYCFKVCIISLLFFFFCSHEKDRMANRSKSECGWMLHYSPRSVFKSFPYLSQVLP